MRCVRGGTGAASAASSSAPVLMLSSESGSTMNLAAAANYCRDLSEACSYRQDEASCDSTTWGDWRLPSADEASQFLGLASIGSNSVWTSSASGISTHWIKLDTGDKDASNETSTYYVRCVRGGLPSASGSESSNTSNYVSSCPSGMSLVGKAGTPNAFCIEQAERAAANWLAASATCSALSTSSGGNFEYDLCSPKEFVDACQNGVASGETALSNTSDNAEWVNEAADSGSALHVGQGSCSTMGNNIFSTSNAYRCCARK